MLACATPQAGSHHDLFEIEKLFEELCVLLESVQINLKGVFLNVDSGFDAHNLRQACEKRAIQVNIVANPRWAVGTPSDWTYFDEELYKRRTMIEHANAWLNSFRALLVRYETNMENWVRFIGWPSWCFSRKNQSKKEILNSFMP